MSKYERIYKDILSKIENYKYKVGETLPGEFELMKIYDASRDTVRKALQLLLQNGYIQKAKGKGSIVLEYNKIAFPVSGVTSFKELSKTMHGTVETIVATCQKIPVSEQLKKDLYMDFGEVWQIERIRKIDGEKIIFDKDYINAAIIPNITEKIAKNSLYEYIEKDLGLRIGFARKEITVVKATKQEKKMLDLQGSDTVVLVTSYCYLENATLFQYTESRHRPDKFRFVDFARREQQ